MTTRDPFRGAPRLDVADRPDAVDVERERREARSRARTRRPRSAPTTPKGGTS